MSNKGLFKRIQVDSFNSKNVKKMWMKFIIKPLKDYMKRGRCYFKKLKTVIMHHYTLKIMNHNESDI